MCIRDRLMDDPASKGSGIPEVKAHLNGIRMPRLFTLQAFVIKFFGTALAVGSGLVLGPEGPLIYLGAALAAGVSRGVKTFSVSICGRELFTKTLSFPWKRVFANDADRRDFIAIGAATGFASAFGAPVGGILFALEETVSFWSPQLLLRGMAATSLATFTLLSCHWIKSGKCCDLENFGLIQLEFDATAHIAVLPFAIVVGCIGGAIGGGFVRAWNALMLHRAKFNKQHHKLIEICVISLITSLVIYYLPLAAGNCIDRSSIITNQVIGMNDVGMHDSFMIQFNCGPGEFNQLASIFYGKRENVIKTLIENADSFSSGYLLLAALVDLGLLLAVYGATVPGGLFLPSILIGTLGGGAFGVFVNSYITSTVEPSSMAIMGAVGMLNGIQRSTVSVTIIIVEGTGKVELLLPIILAAAFSKIVGAQISEGIYDISLQMKRMPILHLDLAETELHRAFSHMTVADVMATNVCTVPSVCSETELKCALTMTNHNGFPVTDGEHVVGLVLRSQLVALIGAGTVTSSRLTPPCPEDRDDTNQKRVKSVSMSTPNQAVQLVDDQLERMSKNRFDDLLVDPAEGVPNTFCLDGIMNRGMVTVNEECPLSTVYQLFCSMGLRHLIVVDYQHKVKGMITRKDLVRCHRLIPDWQQLLERVTAPQDLSHQQGWFKGAK
eukprot:TRINITY_DN4028_c0_g1_i1.p1 TRINITY_DN4028_c0_g1~~TRINITY_DN4028_c0_g1_i1.p1  ORF type:complete len:668 (-),score=166.22 TRINITY_DN4028_c0_g1_i1:190-2193(-)